MRRLSNFSSSPSLSFENDQKFSQKLVGIEKYFEFSDSKSTIFGPGTMNNFFRIIKKTSCKKFLSYGCVFELFGIFYLIISF